MCISALTGFASAQSRRKDAAEILSSPGAAEAVESGRVSREELIKGMESVEKGEISDEQYKEYREKAFKGTLSSEEIEAATKLFEEKKREAREKKLDVVYLYGNVLTPGPYEYKAGMRVLDILPDLASLKEDTYFEYALIKRYEFDMPESFDDDEEEEEEEKLTEPNEEEKEEEEDEGDAGKAEEEEPRYMVTEAGVQVQMITFDLGRLFFSEDETQNIRLMPRDEIHVFDLKTIEKESKKEEKEFFKKDLEEEEEPEDLEIFGHKLFKYARETFTPITAFPVSENYVIGPGDEIKIITWGRMEMTYKLTVDNEGMIRVPRIGPMTAAGLTYGELKKMVREKMETITGLSASVSIGELKTIQVFALGEVKKPGIYSISSLASMTNVLMACGGPTDLGSLRNIRLKRNGDVVAVLDLYEFLMSGDTSADTRLMPGDVVFVPQVGPMVTILGNVKREAIYELERGGTLQAALALAGGLAPGASGQRIQIERSLDNKDQIVLDISQEELKEKKRLPVKDGDRIRVFSILPESVNAVWLYGNVKRPGKYAFEEGMRISDLIPDVEKLEKDTHFEYALIKRYQYNNMKAELLPFDLGKLFFSDDQSQDIRLMRKDEVYVFEKSMFEDEDFVIVEGEVRNPGKHLIDDMTIRDAILKAGDLTGEANMAKGELIRYDGNRNLITIYFNVAAAMANDPSHNHKVRHEDRLIIHSVWESRWEEFVTVRGEVKKKGKYILSKGMTLRDLIFKAGGFTRDAHMDTGHLYSTHPRTKELSIHTFDLEKAMANEPKHNLPLIDQDEIVIHSVWEYREKYTVTVQGLVLNPGEYPYASNMTVRDLILVSGNVRDAAYMDEAELARFSIVGGRKVETSIIQFNIGMARRGHPDHNLKLQPLDVLTIKEIPEWWDKKRAITISGEVYFPGTYQIRDNERISDVVKRAGGYTEQAYLEGAIFTRESVRQVQQARIDEMMRKLEIDIARLSSEEVQTSVSAEDLAAQTQFMTSQKILLEKLKATRATGRVVISLLPLEKFIGTSNNMLLENGDSLEIPKRPHTVNVIGAVYNPTALIHDAGKPELQYYLDMTGGPTDNADEDLMYIIRTNGTVVSNMSKRSWWRKFENTELYPGDTVLVPEKVITTSYLRDTKDITDILYNLAVTAGITITQVFQ